MTIFKQESFYKVIKRFILSMDTLLLFLNRTKIHVTRQNKMFDNCFSTQRFIVFSLSNFEIIFFIFCPEDDVYKVVVFGRMSRVFANGPGDGVQSLVELYQRLKKMVLDTALLSTLHYKVRIKVKWSNPKKGVAPSSTPRYRSD